MSSWTPSSNILILILYHFKFPLILSLQVQPFFIPTNYSGHCHQLTLLNATLNFLYQNSTMGSPGFPNNVFE